jgi:hypothetical protein
MGIGGLSNLLITSLITAGAGDVGSLVGGQDLCMAGVSLVRRSHVRMGGRCASARLEVPTVSLCPRGGLKDFGLLPFFPVVPLGLR